MVYIMRYLRSLHNETFLAKTWKNVTQNHSVLPVVYIALLFLCTFSNISAASDAFSTGIMTLSATSSVEALKGKNSFNIGDFLSPKGEVVLEEVMFSIEDNMNDSGAVKVHLVIAYESELVSELKKMSSQTYFSSVEQLVKDHPEKIKVFEWKLTAKKRVTSWIPIPHDTSFLTPLGGFVFANYSSPGDHRSAVPKTCKKMKIAMEKKDFKLSSMNDED
jgi:type VI secretion system protein